MKSIKGIKHCSTRKAFCISGKNYFHPIDSSKQITVNAGGKENAWKIFKVRGMEGFQVLTVEGRFPRADRSMWFVFFIPNSQFRALFCSVYAAVHSAAVSFHIPEALLHSLPG